MKKFTLPVLIALCSTTLLAQTQGPLTPPDGTKQGLITMVIVFAAVFLIAFVLYKKRRSDEKRRSET